MTGCVDEFDMVERVDGMSGGGVGRDVVPLGNPPLPDEEACWMKPGESVSEAAGETARRLKA